MSVKIKTKENRIPEMTAQLKSMNSRKVKVGAFDGSNAWL